MKILLVNTRHFFGGGDSNYTFSLGALLRQHGSKVSFFAMRDERNLPDPNRDLFVSSIDFREVNRRKSLVNGLNVMGRVIYSREARRGFAQLLDRVNPDVVHLQNIHAHITPSIIFEAKRRRIPVVWTLHDYKLICPNSHFMIDTTGEICEACRGGRFWRAANRRCKKGSFLASGMASLEAYGHQLMNVRGMVDAFLCPSAFLRSKLLENGFDEERAHHLPLFVSEDAFQPASTDLAYVLFLGKLEPLKGIYELLEAASKVPNVRLILAGKVDGLLESQLPSLLPPNASYVGFKTGDELAALRSGASALVLPSLCYENQPLSILEAFASGKPVIASDLGGMRELIGANERGLLVAARDAGALGEAMNWMMEHAEERCELGRKAYQFVREKHTAARHYESLAVIYEAVMAKCSSSKN